MALSSEQHACTRRRIRPPNNRHTSACVIELVVAKKRWNACVKEQTAALRYAFNLSTEVSFPRLWVVLTPRFFNQEYKE